MILIRVGPDAREWASKRLDANMKLLYTSLALLSQLVPSVSIAAEQFATVDTFRISEGSAIITSLTIGSEATYSDDGFFELNGFALIPSDQIEIPLTVRVLTETPDSPPDISTSTFTYDNEEISLLPTYSADAGLSNIEVRKHFYALRFPDESQAFVTVTEDPLPAIAWIVIAGIASVTGTAITIAIICNNDDRKIVIETSHEARLDGTFVSTQKAECAPT